MVLRAGVGFFVEAGYTLGMEKFREGWGVFGVGFDEFLMEAAEVLLPFEGIAQGAGLRSGIADRVLGHFGLETGLGGGYGMK
jgi:hypothetical protein